MLESLKGYRTVAFNVVSGVVLAIAVATGHGVDAQHTAAQVTDALNQLLEAGSAVILAGNVVLRFLTTSPIFNKN